MFHRGEDIGCVDDNDPCLLVVLLGASSAYRILQDIMPGTNGGEWVTSWTKDASVASFEG